MPYPTFENGEKIAIQRGGGLCIAKSTPQKEKAAALFLKWFTSPEQNMRFVASTGYLPVTGKAFSEHMEKEIQVNTNPNIQKILRTAITVHEEYDFYIPPVFDGFNDISTSFEGSFLDIATQKREQYQKNLKTMDPATAYERAVNGALGEFIAGVKR